MNHVQHSPFVRYSALEPLERLDSAPMPHSTACAGGGGGLMGLQMVPPSMHTPAFAGIASFGAVRGGARDAGACAGHTQLGGCAGASAMAVDDTGGDAALAGGCAPAWGQRAPHASVPTALPSNAHAPASGGAVGAVWAALLPAEQARAQAQQLAQLQQLSYAQLHEQSRAAQAHARGLLAADGAQCAGAGDGPSGAQPPTVGALPAGCAAAAVLGVMGIGPNGALDPKSACYEPAHAGSLAFAPAPLDAQGGGGMGAGQQQPSGQPPTAHAPARRLARDSSTAPVRKLSVQLIDTYKLINTVYYERRKRRCAARHAAPCRAATPPSTCAPPSPPRPTRPAPCATASRTRARRCAAALRARRAAPRAIRRARRRKSAKPCRRRARPQRRVLRPAARAVGRAR